MIEIRFHGRGGAGAVTSAELMAIAAINLGKYAQAFPSFGPERRGAPVVAFCRIDDKQIKLRTNINQPHIVLVLDPSLLHIVKVATGLRQGGMLVINSRHSCQDLRTEFGFTCSIAAVDATTIAREATGLPITNVAMLGALLKAREIFAPEALIGPVNKRFGRIAEKNLTAFHRAFAETSVLI
jgi:2-oxoacid:acceptor oxidoreductase gamma subunit (pyruvate/2-ketoisovalerate family)